MRRRGVLQRRTLAFFLRQCYNFFMRPSYIEALDEYFCAHFSDYVRLSALEGYVMPEVLYVAEDGNVARRDSSCMRLCRQSDPAALLQRLKEGFVDASFSFSFSFPSPVDRLADRFRKHTFAKLLPGALQRCGETVQSAGEKLEIDPLFWKKIAKGSLYPEKNTVLALALVCRMQTADTQNLLSVCGFTLDAESVCDVVVRYLLEQKIFNPEMRDACLAEYRLTHLPIRRPGAAEPPLPERGVDGKPSEKA